MATSLPSDDRLPYRDRQGLLALILGALAALGPLTVDMYLPALPSIERDLRTTTSMTQLTLASYFAGLGIGQLAYGPITDRFGRKRPLYVGLVLYVLASAGCALAPNAEALIALRFLQALGGAAGPVVMRAVVRDLYVGPAAARLLSMLILVMGAAPILAPLLGGFTLEVAGWRTIFALLTILGAACLALMAATLPETSTTRTPIEIRALARSVRALLGHRSFVAYTLTGAFSQAGMFAYISGSPFVLIELFHLSPQRYGWLFGANAAGFIAASQVNHRLLSRFSPGPLLTYGTVVTASMGAILISIALTGAGGLPAVAVSLFGFIASIGFIGPNATALAMEEQGNRAGLASAVLGSIQFGLAACASSLVGISNDGSMRPMAGVMAACGAASFLAGFFARR